MITLHGIQSDHQWLNLSEYQLMALGDAIIRGYETRIRLYRNGQRIVQTRLAWGWQTYTLNMMWLTSAQRRTRIRRATQVIAAGTVHISRPSEER